MLIVELIKIYTSYKNKQTQMFLCNPILIVIMGKWQMTNGYNKNVVGAMILRNDATSS